ncbi:LytR/AlgR family response regulator transcription factor [Spirosoma rhododendri]|uniref:Response regulator transcription factor n=1 Tax=Spirosoma rhododendri TaxID=2728024 RepID=A0A7L5DT10_9BACT|nr:response regulator transcription factor [Spirosoma rhododendri]QJD81566.1 response regulator transcription factor [Spirosoma rhododendri]
MADTISILIVEDELLIAETLRYSVEDLGFTVIGIASTFEQAIALIDQHRPDLTLLDINLNSERTTDSGLALADRLANDYRSAFIFLTAYSDYDTILQATRLRPGGYLIKPINPATLFAAIQTTIENQINSTKPAATANQPTQQRDFFFIKVGNRNVKIHWRNVYCLEASKNYVQIRVIGTPVTYNVRGTLSFVQQQLVPVAIQPYLKQFSRSTVINIQHVTHFDADFVYCGSFKAGNSRFSYKELQVLLTDLPASL